MSIAIGFGTTEQTYEAELEKRIRDEVASRISESPFIFSCEFTASIELWLYDLSLASREEADNYKTGDHPDRYSYFYDTTLGDASYLVFILRFHHINRRHPCSPDGWALMQTERVFYIRHGE
jgi:hypothetical protein